MKKYKILIVQQYFYPDISAVSQLLGDLLFKVSKDHKYEIYVLSGNVVRNFEIENKSSQWPEKLGNVNILRLKTTLFVDRLKTHRIFEFLLFFIKSFLYVKLKQNQYDLVISMTTPPLIGFSTSLALGKKIPFIYYIEDLYPELFFDMGYIKKYWIIRKLRHFNHYIFKRADKIITLGSYMSKKLIYNYDIDKRKIIEIPNWTSEIIYQKPIKKDYLHILYSGNLGLAHDFSQIAALIDVLTDSEMNIKFSFYGAGRQYEAVKDLFDKSSISCQFNEYTDRQTHNDVLANADLFLISQKKETVGDIFPSKFYSYIAAGRPMLLLGTSKSEIGKFIINHNAGCILEIEEDIPNIMDFMRNIYTNRDYHLEICDHLHEMDKEMGLDRSYNLFKGLLEEVLHEE